MRIWIARSRDGYVYGASHTASALRDLKHCADPADLFLVWIADEIAEALLLQDTPKRVYPDGWMAGRVVDNEAILQAVELTEL
jgi:hypothetical protein